MIRHRNANGMDDDALTGKPTNDAPSGPKPGALLLTMTHCCVWRLVAKQPYLVPLEVQSEPILWLCPKILPSSVVSLYRMVRLTLASITQFLYT